MNEYKKHPAWGIPCHACGARALSECRTSSNRIVYQRLKIGGGAMLPFHAIRIRMAYRRRHHANL